MPETRSPEPDERSGGQVRHITGGDGRLEVEVRGTGEPLILLHPLALAGRVWDRLAQRLETHHRVITVDVRGHGQSTWGGLPFTIEDLAGDLESILDALELESVDLLGMSMGGGIAMTFAGLHPERVNHLVLADTTAWYGENAEREWAERAEKAVNVPRHAQLAFQTDRWFTEEFRASDPEETQRVVDIFLATDSRVHAAASLAMGSFDGRDLLPAITAPTLVLTGADDYATPPAMGRQIADNVRTARAHVLPELRHLSLIERPELADEILAHLGSTSWSPAGTRQADRV